MQQERLRIATSFSSELTAETHKFATDFSDKHFEQKYTSQSSEKQPSKVSACQHCDLIVYVCLS